MGKYPWWVAEQEQCLWCNKFMNLLVATVNEAGDGIEMTYVCDNPNCQHLTTFKVPGKHVVVQHGKTAVKVFMDKAKESSTGSFEYPEVIDA